MAFVYRAERGRNDISSVGQTTDIVGPGRYELGQLSPKKIPAGAAVAPFSTTQVRDLSGGPKTTLMETPGPGTYLSYDMPSLSPTAVMASGFKSTVARLHVDKSTYIHNPGPGTYYDEASWIRKSHRVPREAQDQLGPESATATSLQFLASRGPPSIPNRDFSYGYEEDPSGRLTRLMPEELGYSGRGADVVGPGRYSWDISKIHGAKGTDFSRGRADRSVFQAKETPGPGTYDSPPDSPSRIFVGQSSAKTLGGPSASFSSAKGRSRSAAKASAAFRSTIDRFKDPLIAAPPPTKYDIVSAGPKKPEGRKVDRLGFGSTRPLESDLDDAHARHAASNLKNPGPAYYNLAGEMAHTRRGGAVAGFKSSSDRFKDRQSKLPGPGAYESEEATSLAMMIVKKGERSSRYGPFGTTTSRFVEDAVAGLNKKLAAEAAPGPGTYEPPTKIVGYKLKDKQKTATFTSATDRFGATLPDVVVRDLLTGDVVDVRPQRPAPGQYDLPDPWTSTSRAAKGVKRDGFGSQSAKVSSLIDKSVLHMPGPGSYTPALPGDTAKRLEVPSAFVSQARRFEEYKTPSPGPAQSYLGQNMVKKSFNITYDA